MIRVSDLIHIVFKGNPKTRFKKREKSAYCASNCRSRVFVPKALSNPLPTILFEETQNSMLQKLLPSLDILTDDLNIWMEISKSKTGEFVLLIKTYEWSSESQTRVFVCNKFIIEEFVDLELCLVMWVSTTWGSSRFKIKFLKTFILLVNCCLVDCLS